ncbi:unnamed protein product [Diatraea saccharalis]|uniref:Uncharacterized protein n=1 Tax=Diatraea saccharalis TaxID=40085 RepID=A0A9N9RCT4_9NEOP|nr:unnamed protein product [Diatraea saccharalis]
MPWMNSNNLPSPNIANNILEYEIGTITENNNFIEAIFASSDDYKQSSPNGVQNANTYYMSSYNGEAIIPVISTNAVETKKEKSVEDVKDIGAFSVPYFMYTNTPNEVQTNSNNINDGISALKETTVNKSYRPIEYMTNIVNDNSASTLFTESVNQQNTLYEVQSLERTENDYNPDNLIRCKNSIINYYLPEITNENLDIIRIEASAINQNQVNNLYNLESLPYTDVNCQNPSTNKKVSNDNNNPIVKDNIKKYLNSIRMLKYYQSKGQNEVKTPTLNLNSKVSPKVANNLVNTINAEPIISNIKYVPDNKVLKETVNIIAFPSESNTKGISNFNDERQNTNINIKSPMDNILLNYNDLHYFQNDNYQRNIINPLVNNNLKYVTNHNNDFISHPLVDLLQTDSNANTFIPYASVKSASGILSNEKISIENINPISYAVPTTSNTISESKIALNTKFSDLVPVINNFNNQFPNIQPVLPSTPFNNGDFLYYTKPEDITIQSQNSLLSLDVTKLNNLKTNSETYTTSEILSPLNTQIVSRSITPAEQIKTQLPAIKLPRNPSQYTKSYIGLNSVPNLRTDLNTNTSPGFTKTVAKFNLEKLPIKPELLASVKPIPSSSYSSRFGVSKLLNTVTNKSPNFLEKTKNPYSNYSPNIENFEFNLNKNVNEAFPGVPASNTLENINENSNVIYRLNTISSSSPSLTNPRTTNVFPDNSYQILNKINPIIDLPKPNLKQINQYKFLQEIETPQYPLNIKQPVNQPENFLSNNIPIPNMSPKYPANINTASPSLYPTSSIYNNIPLVKTPPNIPINETPENEPDNSLKYVNNAAISGNFPNLPSSYIFSQDFIPSIANTNLKSIQPDTSPLLFISSAPDIKEVPIISYINNNGKYTTQDFPRDYPKNSGLPFQKQYESSPNYLNTGYITSISYLPKVNPSQNYILPQASASYLNLPYNNPLSSQIEKMLSPSGVVGSINDAASVVTKNVLTTLLLKKLTQNKTPKNIQPASPPPRPETFYPPPRAVVDPSIFWEPFYIYDTYEPQRKVLKNAQLYNGFEVPDLLSQLDFEIPNIVPDYSDLTDFNNFESEVSNMTPYMASLTVNVMPVIEEFGFKFKGSPDLPCFDYPSISPSYLPEPVLPSPPVIDLSAMTTKNKDDSELGRLLRLLVLNELLNNNDFNEGEALETAMALLFLT